MQALKTHGAQSALSCYKPSVPFKVNNLNAAIVNVSVYKPSFGVKKIKTVRNSSRQHTQSNQLYPCNLQLLCISFSVYPLFFSFLLQKEVFMKLCMSVYFCIFQGFALQITYLWQNLKLQITSKSFFKDKEKAE